MRYTVMDTALLAHRAVEAATKCVPGLYSPLFDLLLAVDLMNHAQATRPTRRGRPARRSTT